MQLTDYQKNIIESSLWQYINMETNFVESGNMDQYDYKLFLENVTIACQKLGIRDMAAQYQDDKAEEELDMRAAEAHDAYHNW